MSVTKRQEKGETDKLGSRANGNRNVPVKQTQSEVATIPMGSKWHLHHCSQVVNPIQVRCV